MKKTIFVTAFIVSIAGAFAFKGSSNEYRQKDPNDVTLFSPPEVCTTEEICNPANSGAVCTDLYIDRTKCLQHYAGSARHEN